MAKKSGQMKRGGRKKTVDDPNYDIFCREFAIDFNAARAARAAGYSEKAAKQQGHTLLTNTDLQTKIKEILQARIEKVEIRGEEVLRRLNDIGDFDPADCYDPENNTLKNIHEIPAHIRKCIKSIRVDEIFEYIDKEKIKVGETTTVTFWDKVKSNELLGRNQKLFTDKLEVKDTTKISETLAKARARANKK